MAEGYSGVKFKVVMQEGEMPVNAGLPELKKWCGLFHEKGLAPPYPGGSYGNLSFRVKEGENAFVITGTCMGLKGCLNDDNFVLVTDCDAEALTVTACGSRLPSSESMMHFALYQTRPDIQAIFHGHSPEILEQAEALGILVTAEEHPYGTLELANALEDCARQADFFIARNHGFVSLGRNMEAAGKQAIDYMQQALNNIK
jgi:ribulose-5-phosphate 4-epimerase/fuculose-1-phosphate aldolase